MVKNAKTLTVSGGAASGTGLSSGNISVAVSTDADTGNGTLSVALVKDVDLGSDGSVTAGNTVLDNTGVATTGGAFTVTAPASETSSET